MTPLAVAAGALAVLVHSAGPQAAPSSAAPAPGSSPADGATALQRALARELPPLAVQPFRTRAGFEGSVEAISPPEVKAEEGAEELTIALGTEQALTCTLFSKRVDAGATVWRLAESVRKSLKLLLARPVEVLAVEGSPLVLAEIGYQSDGEKGPVPPGEERGSAAGTGLVGQLKVAVYAHDAHSFLCLHDEPGYARTFARVVKGLASSLRGGEDARVGARFAEIAVMRIGPLPTGYTEHVVWDRRGGGRVAASYTAQLLPRGPADLVAVDSYSEEESDASDLLSAASYAHLTNGDADARIQLTRAKDGRTFRYEGEKDGKALRGSFRTKAGLSTDLWFARRLAASAKPPKGELRHEAYSYEANPVGALPAVCRRDPAGGRRASMDVGAIRLSGELDANGLFATGEVPVGPTKLVIERTWSRGAP
jgi:hypothetical protein